MHIKQLMGSCQVQSTTCNCNRKINEKE